MWWDGIGWDGMWWRGAQSCRVDWTGSDRIILDRIGLHALSFVRSTRSRSATLPIRECIVVVPSLMMFSTGKSLAVAHLASRQRSHPPHAYAQPRILEHYRQPSCSLVSQSTGLLVNWRPRLSDALSLLTCPHLFTTTSAS